MTIPLPPLPPAERARFRAAVTRHFAFMKRTATAAELAARTIPMTDGLGALQVICDLHRDDDGVIRDLSAWRDMHQAVFPTRFVVSDAGTRRWLREAILDSEDRILFFVIDPTGRRIGHIGLARCLNDYGVMEMSNGMRGVAKVSPGIMRQAFVTIMEWARVKMQPTGFDMRVFTHNTHALALYHRLGFRRKGEMPLRLHRQADREDYLPCTPDDHAPPDAIHMFLLRDPADPDGHAPTGYVLPASLPA